MVLSAIRLAPTHSKCRSQAGEQITYRLPRINGVLIQNGSLIKEVTKVHHSSSLTGQERHKRTSSLHKTRDSTAMPTETTEIAETAQITYPAGKSLGKATPTETIQITTPAPTSPGNGTKTTWSQGVNQMLLARLAAGRTNVEAAALKAETTKSNWVWVPKSSVTRSMQKRAGPPIASAPQPKRQTIKPVPPAAAPPIAIGSAPQPKRRTLKPKAPTKPPPRRLTALGGPGYNPKVDHGKQRQLLKTVSKWRGCKPHSSMTTSQKAKPSTAPTATTSPSLPSGSAKASTNRGPKPSTKPSTVVEFSWDDSTAHKLQATASAADPSS